MRYKVFSDGGSRGNPGLSGCGYIVYDNQDNIVKESAFPIGISTNNIAEYTAVLEAAKYLDSNHKPFEADFFLDSELIVKQVNGEYRVKDSKLKILFLELTKILSSANYTFTHVRREKNTVADRLSNIGCDMNETT